MRDNNKWGSIIKDNLFMIEWLAWSNILMYWALGLTLYKICGSLKCEASTLKTFLLPFIGCHWMQLTQNTTAANKWKLKGFMLKLHTSDCHRSRIVLSWSPFDWCLVSLNKNVEVQQTIFKINWYNIELLKKLNICPNWFCTSRWDSNYGLVWGTNVSALAKICLWLHCRRNIHIFYRNLQQMLFVF